MRLFLLPYKTGSKSAKLLAEVMGIKRCAHSRTVPNIRQRTVINWGHSGQDLSEYVLSNTERVYNPPSKVSVAINKLHCLEALTVAGVRTPAFTTDIAQARQWITDHHKEVVERHMLRSSGGEGICIRNDANDLRIAPLYTQYVKKKHEYRVHVINGQVADVQRKAKRSGASIFDWKIRNLESGFIFVRGQVSPPQDVIDQALLAIQAVDLDFGAVDVIWNAHEEKAYVLEVNTACGLEGTTLEVYADGLRNMIEGTALREWTYWQEVIEETQHEVIEEPRPPVCTPQCDEALPEQVNPMTWSSATFRSLGDIRECHLRN